MSSNPDQLSQPAMRSVIVLPASRRLRYVRLRRFGVDLVLVMVSERVLDDPQKCETAAAHAYLVFHIPTVLVSPQGHRLHGRADVVRMLRNVDVARLPWRLRSTAA